MRRAGDNPWLDEFHLSETAPEVARHSGAGGLVLTATADRVAANLGASTLSVGGCRRDLFSQRIVQSELCVYVFNSLDVLPFPDKEIRFRDLLTSGKGWLLHARTIPHVTLLEILKQRIRA